MANKDCVRGWVEVLHWKLSDTKKIRALEHAELNSLNDIDEKDYDMVGSALPLQEYFSLFEVYKQFADAPADRDFGIPRAFRPFDAINVCANEPTEPEVGRSIKTIIFVPKGYVDIFSYTGCRTQYHPSYPLVLMPRRVPFASFTVPRFGA